MQLRLLKNVDWPLMVAVVLLSVLGSLMVSSASASEARYQGLAARQAIWICLGLGVAGALMWMDYQLAARLSRWLYGINLALLSLVLYKGHSIAGSQRWIELGWTQLQPSELAKVLIVITLADLLRRGQETHSPASVLFRAALHVGVPMLLVFAQPDLGTALVFVVLWLGMLWIWGLSRGYLVALAVTGGLLAAGAWHLGVVRDYQRTRLAAFLDPEHDPGGSGYQLLQSQIAIGAGGLWGAGLYRGTQNRLAFIPAQTTDFIFTIAGEELGFVGCMTILALYLFILWRGVAIAAATEDPLGALIATGVLCIFAFQAFINLGMTMRLCPVTGLPLPFVSYGGSSLLTSFMGVGLLQSVSMRRRAIQF